MDTTTLKARRPWYSLEYNDNISALTVAPWSMTDISAYLVSHQVGQKQYELTNHLGNVQATVSDLPYAGGEYYITRKAPALPAVYDYYPFGMLMPGRYTSDTTGKCMTISQTKWVTRWADSCYLAEERMTATLGGATWNNTGGTLNGTSTASNAGLILQVNGLIPDVAQELSFEFEDVMSGAPQIWVSEEQNGIEVSLGSVLVHGKGTTTLTVKPKFGPVHVTLLGPFTFKMKKVCVKVPQLIQQEMLVDVCSDMKDRYRFGFNGQEKVNEWSGVGNYMDFGARLYDSRLARFPTLDLLKFDFPGYSPFIFFALNRPIDGYDNQGMKWVQFNPSNKGTIIFDSRAVNDTKDVIINEYNEAKRMGMNIILANTWDELLDDLQEKNKVFHNLIFGGHGYIGGNNLHLMGTTTPASIAQNWETILNIGKFIDKDGSVILLGCFEGAPLTKSVSWGLMDKTLVRSQLAKCFNRKIYGNSGYTSIMRGMFSGQFYQIHSGRTLGPHAEPESMDKLNEELKGMWMSVSPDGTSEIVGGLAIRPDGSSTTLKDVFKSFANGVRQAINNGSEKIKNYVEKQAKKNTGNLHSGPYIGR